MKGFIAGQFIGTVAVLSFLLGFVLGPGRSQPVETPEPPLAVVVEAEPPLQALGDADERLFARFLPHIRKTAREQIEAEFRKVDEELDSPKLGAPLGGPWGTLAAILINIVKKILALTLYTLVVGVLVSLFWAYWYFPAFGAFVWFVLTTAIAEWRARANKGKA